MLLKIILVAMLLVNVAVIAVVLLYWPSPTVIIETRPEHHKLQKPLCGRIEFDKAKRVTVSGEDAKQINKALDKLETTIGTISRKFGVK